MSDGGFDFASLTPPPRGSTLAAEWWVAWGHLRSKQSATLINVVTGLAIAGVMVGVAVLNCVIAVMAGLEVDLRDKILGANAHMVVMEYGPGGLTDADEVTERVASVPGVLAAAPFTSGEVMIRSRFGHTGVVLKGVDPARTGDVTHLRGDLAWGLDGELTTDAQRAAAFDRIAAPIPSPFPEIADDVQAHPGIFVGKGLQAQLNIRPGEKVQLINPLGSSTGVMGMPTPTVRTFRVAGVFDSGMFEYDNKWTYVRNEDAQDFLKLGDGVMAGIEVKLQDIYAAPEVADAVEQKLGRRYVAKHWQELNEKLFSALRLEKYVMSVILSMIVCVAALLIISTLLMVVLTKAREIAILKAMGASEGMIMRIFMMQGVFIATIGVVAGTVLGLLGCAALDAYGWELEVDVYFVETLPVLVEPANVVAIAVVAFVICFTSTVLPARLAAGLDPVEGLRYE